ncbi:hypothetical protein CBL_08583 [Carabus blaptoides fortunei]
MIIDDSIPGPSPATVPSAVLNCSTISRANTALSCTTPKKRTLLEKLKLEKTLACGTIRTNRRGCPKNLTSDKNMKRGDSDYRISNTDISFFKWRDNRFVFFASNFHGTETTTVGRKEKDGTKKQVACPSIVSDYNKHMGAVDHADQLRGTFVNTYILYAKTNKDEDPITLLKFRRALAQGLINRFTNAQQTKKRGSVSQRNETPKIIAKKRKYNYSVSNDVRLGNRAVNTNLKKLPYSKVKHVVYEKGNNVVKYKTTFTTEVFQLESILVKKKLRKNNAEDILLVPKVVGATKNISEHKINSIRSLYPQFPPIDTEFWECVLKQPENAKETNNKRIR